MGEKGKNGEAKGIMRKRKEWAGAQGMWRQITNDEARGRTRRDGEGEQVGGGGGERDVRWRGLRSHSSLASMLALLLIRSSATSGDFARWSGFSPFAFDTALGSEPFCRRSSAMS